MTKSDGRPPPQINWDTVYWECTPRLLNYFRYRTGDEQIAQDLTSQTMLKAWGGRHQYSHDLSKFETWLFRIAQNVLIDHWRRHGKRSDVTLHEAIFDDTANVERDVAQRIEAERLYALIQQLPEREQAIIALKYGADQTNRAIAETLNMSESNIGTILHRVVRKLRAAWLVDERTSAKEKTNDV